MSNWRGKSWCTLGDSITAAGVYQPLVQQAGGFESVSNEGQSGCPMTAGGDRDEGSTVRVGMRITQSFDCITVFAGTNDFRLDKPLGRLTAAGGPHDIYTFIGAYQTLIEHLLRLNPLCRLNVWTPLQRDKDGYDTDSVNEAGCRLIDYVGAVRETALVYALPVLDLYAVSGFSKPTLDVLTTDRLHPNEAGHARIAGLAAAFLQAI